ncbi:major facilitator superfamily transporter [Cadophora sp. MPI-SDFR-AT-0126]|nr:major facilitator superfamily transporter [Leotiomycetes sp. MPI-SDFR-AT-0126]
MSHPRSTAARRVETPGETSPLLPQPEENNIFSNTSGFSTPQDVTAKAAPVNEYMAGVKLWLLVTAITLGTSLVLLDMSIIATAIPQITTEFHTLADVGWYGSSYLLASSALQPLTGKLYARFNIKYTFLCFFALFEAGSCLCGFAPTSYIFIAGRSVSGLGAAGIVNGAYTIVAAAVPMEKRPALIGIIMMVGQVGMVGGPILGGLLTSYASWRWCFLINIPLGAIVVAFLGAIDIPEVFAGRVNSNIKVNLLSTVLSLDPVGFLLFTAFSIMFLLGLQGAERSSALGLFLGAAATFAIFGVWEYVAKENAMFPYSMLRKRVVWSSCVVILLFQGCALVYSFFVPIYFQASKGAAPVWSGLYNSPGIGSQMIVAGVSSALVGKWGYYLPWSISSAILVILGSCLMSTLNQRSSAPQWVGYQIIAGIGRGCGATMPMVAVQNILPLEQIPLGMSLISFCQTFGGTLSLSVAQNIFTCSLREGLARFAPTVDVEKVLNAGATGFRDVVQPSDVFAVTRAFDMSLRRIFYLAAALSLGCFTFVWGMGWHSVKAKRESRRDPAPEA